MGCGTMKEKLENEMIAMKLERVAVQMERRNQIKLLEDIDGRKIDEPNIPDYLILKNPDINKTKNIKTKDSDKISYKNERSKSLSFKKSFKKDKSFKTIPTESKKTIRSNISKKKLKK